MGTQNIRDVRKFLISEEVSSFTDYPIKDKMFAHYTTAECAFKIISNQKLWLRNCDVMNDSSEVETGLRVIEGVLFSNDDSTGFLAALGAIRGSLPELVMRAYSSMSGQMRDKVYIASLSEFDLKDKPGRLSMWRAYGGGVGGAALIFNRHIATSFLDDAIFFGKCIYHNNLTVKRRFQKLSADINKEIDLFRSVDDLSLAREMAFSLWFYALSLKDEAFSEEREWRLIYNLDDEQGDRLGAKVEVIKGVPQIVYEVPLSGGVSLTLNGGHSLGLLDKILIGPCAYPDTVRKAFVRKLRELNVAEPGSRVEVSSIPLRF